MANEQLNFINIFDEQLELDKKEKAEEEKEKKNEPDSITQAVKQYWQDLASNEKLSKERQVIISSYEDSSLEELLPFMTEINWYMVRMRDFRLVFEEAENGKPKEIAYMNLVNPDIVDIEYKETAKLFCKYRVAYEKNQAQQIEAAYLSRSKKDRKAAIKLRRLEKEKKIKAKSDAEKSDELRRETENRNRYEFMKWINQTGKFAASGEEINKDED